MRFIEMISAHVREKGLAHFGHRAGIETRSRCQACPQSPQIHFLSGSPSRTSLLMLVRTGDSESFGAGAISLTISA